MTSDPKKPEGLDDAELDQAAGGAVRDEYAERMASGDPEPKEVTGADLTPGLSTDDAPLAFLPGGLTPGLIPGGLDWSYGGTDDKE